MTRKQLAAFSRLTRLRNSRSRPPQTQTPSQPRIFRTKPQRVRNAPLVQRAEHPQGHGLPAMRLHFLLGVFAIQGAANANGRKLSLRAQSNFPREQSDSQYEQPLLLHRGFPRGDSASASDTSSPILIPAQLRRSLLHRGP